MLTEPGDRGRVLDAAAHLRPDTSPAMTAAIGAALRERESLGSTAIGHGVAIPHARSNAFSAARGAFLRLEHPDDFGARDHAPVDLVFAMSVPEHSSQQYLEILSELAERFRSEEHKSELQSLMRISYAVFRLEKK